MHRNCLLLAAGLALATGRAQILPLDTIAAGVRPLYTLQDAGLKYMTADVQGLTSAIIYNLDLSVYRVLAVPPPPPGFNYNAMSYVTEDLFDTDPSTIEYMINASAGFSFITLVYREDGTPVFSAIGSPNAAMAQYLVGGYDPIVSTDQGPVLHLSPAPLANEVRRYLLPGELPCLDCASMGITGMAEEPGHGAEVLSFPNPATEQVTLEFTLPQGARSGVLVVFDDQGRSVATRPVDSSGQLQLNTAQMANGMYYWHILTKSGMVQGQRIIVAH